RRRGTADHPGGPCTGDPPVARGHAPGFRGTPAMSNGGKWKRAALLVVVALIAAAVLLAWLLPPKLPAYRVEAQPLVQQVVATGRIISTSRSQVGSEITATVLERHVREGDRAEPGQLLVTLQAADLEAAVREAEAALQRRGSSTRPETQARRRQAEAQLSQASREARRREELVERGLIARESVEQAQEAESVARA